jgi:hypothetical protein
MKPNTNSIPSGTLAFALAASLLALAPTLASAGGNALPAVQITRPASGAIVIVGEPVEIEATVVDPDGHSDFVEFYHGAEKIGESSLVFIREPDPGQPQVHQLQWRPAREGQHLISAKARDNAGAWAQSGELAIVVQAKDAGLPVITSIQIENSDIVVACKVPAGVKKVTLESRTRLGAGTWVPRAVTRVGDTGTLTFRLDKSEQLEVLRVRGDAQEALPANFYAGQTNFDGQASTSAPAGDQAYRFDAVGPNPAPTGAPAETTRQVVESDIWKVRGQTLYFFNQYRGLQVINLSQPDAPGLQGTLELPASGEQMYVLDGPDTAPKTRYVVLLVRDDCGWSGSQGSRVLIVEDTGATPKVITSLPIQGQIVESRLVGTALYIASQTYRKVTVPILPDGQRVGESWEWGSVVTSFDLANPLAPVARDTLWYAGYGNVIYATDKFLFVAVADPINYWKGTVYVTDISAPDGAMSAKGSLQPVGRVADKFKMNLSGQVFTVITEDASWTNDRSQRRSVLETFSLADPNSPRKLGQLEVGHGESLFATRFDDDRVYIVTFLRIDPLWVVDLRDPANPKLSGELQVPGWSTYIQPLGDRLVAVGIDNSNSWRVAISLFDVRDPAKPGLLAKVPLGENHSWSEANQDEKALSVLPEAGLILVPYQTWATNGYATRVQLIDLGADTLKGRGVIEHQMQPRRATVFTDRILSISGRELLVVNAVDRDNPVVTSELELSWAVDRVLLAGDFLLEFAEGNDWQGAPNPIIRVAKTAQADQVLSRLALSNNLPVLGAVVRDSKLYIAQGTSDYYYWAPVILAETAGDQSGQPEKKPTLFLSIYDLSALPELKLAGSTEAVTSALGWGTTLQPLWAKPGILVWSAGGGMYWRWWWGGPWLDVVRPGLAVDAIGMPWWGGGGGGRLFAFDVADATTPKFAAEVNLTGTNQWWNYGEAFTADGLVYLSHQGSMFVEGATLPGQDTKPQTTVTIMPDGTKATNVIPVGIWVTKYYLDVVDFADPTAPAVRKPVNIPGQLIGLSHGGALLYTIGSHWDANGTTDGRQYLDASAYDGLQAALVDSLKLTNSWPQPLIGPNGLILLTQNGADATARLEAWSVSDNGKFGLLGTMSLAGQLSSLKTFGNLLAVQMGQKVQLLNVSNPAQIATVGSGASPGCLWPDLSFADGDLSQGVWAPLRDYGVLAIPAGAKP